MVHVLLSLFILPLLVQGQDPYAAERERMVREDLEARDVRDPAVLKTMRATPRHLFVPETLRSIAYADRPLPIGEGQTISQPYIVGLMTQLLAPSKEHKVLEIGTGSGYQAAVLSPLVRHLYTIEIVPALASRAKTLLAQLGYANITVREGDGYAGWPSEAPFDRIILTAAPPELPGSLVAQLKPGGKLVAPVGASAFSQSLIVVDKTTDGKVKRRSVAPVMFVPMVRKP